MSNLISTLDEVVRQQIQKIAKMTATIYQKDRRIAELEAEVALLKKAPEKTLGELFVEKVFSQPVSPEIEQARKNLRRERFSNNVLRFEEGEG